ncbi:hypothetical protein HYH03_016478 [Edaphochlamys debaryana]|uniref:Uncharacterized protein n=1 Tax=Edaphochlamys debaryana TaxID=47281 RepID=A0A835XM46_9CHLO|nr:hypothetical protein HYH03_016478 [Edaphochlamys debaryana]|eukprot:KAG2484731.1 hypothetical protein HYH03_016478 [Edaphochlamys debaryana]
MRRSSDSAGMRMVGGRVTFGEAAGSATSQHRLSGDAFVLPQGLSTASGAPYAPPRQQDPGALLQDFDSKLKSIQDVLSKYNATKAAQARGGTGAVAPSEPDVDRAATANSKRRAQAAARAAATGLELTAEDLAGRTGFEAPRRVKSAAPGATRALSLRIEYYRQHMNLAVEKAERAKAEQAALEAEKAAAEGDGGGAPRIDFVSANRRSIQSFGLPYPLQATIESLRDQGLDEFRRRGVPAATASGGGGSRPGSRPLSAVPAYARGSGGVSAAGGGGPAWRPFSAGRTGPPSRPFSSAPRPASSRPGGPAQAQAQVHEAWTAHVGGATHRSSAPSISSPSAAGPGLGPSVAWDTEAGPSESASVAGPGARGRSSTFLTQLQAQQAAYGVIEEGDDDGETGDGGDGRVFYDSPDPRTPSHASTPASPAAHHRPPRSAPPGVHGTGAGGGGRPPTGLSVQVPGGGAGVSPAGGGRQRPFTASAAVRRGSYDTSTVGARAGVDGRSLRLALTARPASGGSPTRRLDFIAEHVTLREQRAQHAMEVRERAAFIEAERRAAIANAAALRAQQRKEEEERAAAERAAAELAARQMQWTAVVGLCSKLHFLAEQVAEDRRVRSLRAMRKEAAVRIATWYKHILLRRRQIELVELMQRLKRLVKPYVARSRVVVRQVAAERIVHFLRYAESSNMAVVGVRKLKSGVEVLQTAWRNALLVRNLQQTALYNQITRLEKEVVINNKKNHRNVQLQMMRMGNTYDIMIPDATGYGTPGYAGGYGYGGGYGTSFRHRPSPSAGISMRSGGFAAAAALAGDSSRSLALSLYNEQSYASGGHTYKRGRSARERERLLPPPDPEEDHDEVLKAHMDIMPREMRERVVDSFLLEARKAHRKLLEKYSADKALYQARRPLEEMRLKMLRDAGFTKAQPELQPPEMPHMRIVYPRADLRELLKKAMALNQARLARIQEEAEAERQRWEEQRARNGDAGAGGGGGGGGVMWADQLEGATAGYGDSGHGYGGGGGGGLGYGGGGGGGGGSTARNASPLARRLAFLQHASMGRSVTSQGHGPGHGQPQSPGARRTPSRKGSMHSMHSMHGASLKKVMSRQSMFTDLDG